MPITLWYVYLNYFDFFSFYHLQTICHISDSARENSQKSTEEDNKTQGVSENEVLCLDKAPVQKRSEKDNEPQVILDKEVIKPHSSGIQSKVSH